MGDYESELLDKLDPPGLPFDETLDDDELFAQAMSGVQPVSGARRRLPPRKPKPPLPQGDSPSRIQQQFLDDREEDHQLQPGYVEGGVGRANRRLMRKLRRGRFSVQEELDLHGMTQTEARQELALFLRESVQNGLSCVRIIHGKGKNSPNQKAVLREKLPIWLAHRRNADKVLAFTSAQPRDGGAGATYVLLRKPK